jgi:hypothetical protein
MGAARTATPIIRRSRPAGRTDVDVAEEHAPGRDWLAIISRPTFEEFGRSGPALG